MLRSVRQKYSQAPLRNERTDRSIGFVSKELAIALNFVELGDRLHRQIFLEDVECDRSHPSTKGFAIALNFLELGDRFHWEIFLEGVEFDRSHLSGQG